MVTCRVCRLAFVDAQDYEEHLGGDRHRALATKSRGDSSAAAAQSADSVVTDTLPLAVLEDASITTDHEALAGMLAAPADYDYSDAAAAAEPDDSWVGVGDDSDDAYDRLGVVRSTYVDLLRRLYELPGFTASDVGDLAAVRDELVDISSDVLFPYTDSDAAFVGSLFGRKASKSVIGDVLAYVSAKSGGDVPSSLTLFERDCVRELPELYKAVDLGGDFDATTHTTELLFVLVRWLLDPELYAQFTFDPPLDEGVRDEFVSGALFRRMASRLPVDPVSGCKARPIVVGHGSDETRLSFGGAYADPHTVYPLNVPQLVFTKARARDVAQYLPDPDVSTVPTPLQPVVRLFYHHRAMRRFYRHVARWAREGVWLPTASGGSEFFAVFLGPPTGDLPVLCAEASAFSANFAKLARACLICQCPGRLLGTAAQFPLQVFADNQRLIGAYIDAVRKDDRKRTAELAIELRQRSLHPVQSGMHDVPLYNPNLPLFDLEHRLFSGIAQVALEGLREFIAELAKSKQKHVNAQLDRVVGKICAEEHLPGVRNFSDGISGMGITQQKIVESIVKVLPGVLQAMPVLDETSMDRALVVQAFVLLREYAVAARGRTWKPEKIKAFQHLGAQLRDVLPRAFPNMSWTTRPKFDGLDLHVDLIIDESGRLDNGSTRPIEEGHRGACKIPYQYSDRRNYLQQFAHKATLLFLDKLCRRNTYELGRPATTTAAAGSRLGRAERRDLRLGGLLLLPGNTEHLRGLPEVLHMYLIGQNRCYAERVSREGLLATPITVHPYVTGRDATGAPVPCHAGVCHRYVRHDTVSYESRPGHVAYGRLVTLLAFRDLLDGRRHELAVMHSYDRADPRHERHPLLHGIWMRRTTRLVLCPAASIAVLWTVEDCHSNNEFSLSPYVRSAPLVA